MLLPCHLKKTWKFLEIWISGLKLSKNAQCRSTRASRFDPSKSLQCQFSNCSSSWVKKPVQDPFYLPVKGVELGGTDQLSVQWLHTPTQLWEEELFCTGLNSQARTVGLKSVATSCHWRHWCCCPRTCKGIVWSGWTKGLRHKCHSNDWLHSDGCAYAFCFNSVIFHWNIVTFQPFDMPIKTSF